NLADQERPVPGANDGASGVAVLLGVADALKERAPSVGVDLLFVDGEDYGDFGEDKDVLLGSRYYAGHLLRGAKPLYAILFDLIDFQYGPDNNGYGYWHTTEDTADKVSAQSLAIVGNVAVALTQ